MKATRYAGFSAVVKNAISIFLIFSALFFFNKAFSQTNPAAQALPYSTNFSTLTGSAPAAYPAGWQGWAVATSAPSSTGRTTAPTGDKAIAVGNASSTGNGVYDYNGKLGFLSSASTDNAIALAINTTGYSNVIITFDAMTIRNTYDGTTNYINGLVLQYRVGTTGAFTNITYTPTEYQNSAGPAQTSGTTGQNIVTGLKATLPSACDNQAVVQIRWIYRTVSGTTGTSGRPTMAIDNVNVYQPIPPTLSTGTPSSITASSAALGGSISSDGGQAVTRRGFIYSTGAITDTNSTTAGGKIIDPSTGIGSFSAVASGLTNNTTYYVRAFAVNAAGVALGSTQSFTTLESDIAPSPTSQPTNYNVTSLTCNGMTVNWTSASGNPDGYLVLRTSGTSTPSTSPVNTVQYSVGNTLGNATVIFSGSGNAVVLNSLPDNTTYTYTIYSFNGSGALTSYLTTNPLTGTTSTLSVAGITALPVTNVYSNKFTASWTGTAACATSYSLNINQTIDGFENSLNSFSVLSGAATYFTGNGGFPVSNRAYSGLAALGVNNSRVEILSRPLNTSSYSNGSFSFRLGAFGNSNASGLDLNDTVLVEVSPDGGLNYYKRVLVTGNNQSSWGYTGQTNAINSYANDNNYSYYFPASGTTGIQTDGASLITINNLPSSANLRIKITLANNTSTEWWVIDEAILTDRRNGIATPSSYVFNNAIAGIPVSYSITSNAPNSSTLSNIINFSTLAAATPAINAPVVSNITTMSADLTVNVVNTGSTSSISERGTVYKTSSGVTATDNVLVEGNATTGSFTQTRSPLNPETRYYAKGYAVNAEGAGLSPEIDFFTWSNPPITQASGLGATPYSANQIDLTWTTADFPSSGATAKRYLLLRATAPNVPVFTGSNGQAPTVDANTTIVNQDISSTTTQASATGLTANTDYNFLLIPFTWNGTDNATYNYLTTGAPTTSGSTTDGTPAVLTATTVTDITPTSAILGATIDSDGGSGIQQRGTVYSTSSPVNITNNTLEEGGYDIGTFTQSRTDLQPQTRYYFAGYAVTNSGSLSLSPESSFYTLSYPPSVNASGLTATPVSGAQINLSWSPATFPSNGATVTAYLLLRADYPNMPSITNVNGQAPVAGANTTIVNAAVSGAATTASSAGLTGNTQYNYILIPYTWDGVNAATYNYLTTGAPSASASTMAPIPATQPFGLSFTGNSCNAMTVTWRTATSLPTGYIVLRSTGSTEPTTDPTPGVVYAQGSTIDNAVVAYAGTDTTFVSSSLTNTTPYNFKIYAYNGTDAGNISYNIVNPLKGTQTTSIPAAPVAVAATGISLTQFTANWNAESCANNGYKFDLSLFPNFYDPNGSATTLALESFENALSLFTATGSGSIYLSGNSPITNKPPASAGGTYPFAATGTYGYGVTNGTNVLTSNDINTTGYESTGLSFKLGAFSYLSTSNGLDVTDLVKVEISPDGGNNWYNTLVVTGNNNAYWGYDATGVASTAYDGDNNATTFTPVNTGNNLTTGFSTINITGLPSSTNLKVRITLIDNSSELWIIDNFTVNGRAASFLAPYNNFSVAGTSQVVSGLTPNTNYYYRVRAFGNGAASLNSNIITATPESGFATVNTPTVTSITNNSAVLGATVVNTGSDVSISARGTVYKTITGVTATDNALAEGGTDVSAFSHLRSGLTAQTRYFFKGYATNSYGTGVSIESNFYTLSNPATSAAGSFAATPFSSDEVNLSWTAATFPSTGATVKGYVILSALYPNVPSLGNANGQAPSAGTNSTVVTSSLSATATATSATGLTGDTRYNFTIIPYTWDGVNEATYNYYTTDAPVLDATTLMPVTALPPTGLSITNITCNGMTVSWTPGVGSDGTIVLQTSGVAVPNTNPTPNVFYTTGSVIGNATVAYVGAGSSFTLSSLLDNNNYNFKIISYNSTGTDIGYLSGSPLNASQTTTSAAVPVANSAINISSSSFTAGWNAVNCATNYLLYAYTNNVSNVAAWTFPTFGGSTYCDSSVIVSGNPNYGVSNFSLSSGTQGDVSGNGTRAATASTWSTVGKNWQVIVNTVGYTNIKVSSVQYSSAAGPRDFKLQYKIGAGGIWTDISGGNITVATDYTTGVVNDLALPAACQGIPDLYIRWATTSTTAVNLSTIGGTNTGGTSRIDNIYVKGNLVQYIAGYNGLSVSGTSSNITGLAAGTQYYYHVKAVGTGGGQTAISNVIPVTTLNDIATADFRTKASGNFTDVNIWQYKSTATTYVDATSAPTSNNNIIIRAVDSVNMNTDFVINTGKTVTDSGKINMNSFVISGLGSCKIVAGATMYTSNVNGVYSSSTTPATGSITTSSRTFDAAANYVFNGSSAQSTSGLPSPMTGTTIIANAAGVTLNANKTINSPGAIIVSSNGKLSFGTGILTNVYSINGTGSFTAQTGATLVITSSNGIYAPGTPTVADTLGSIRVSGQRTFASNVNYEISKNDGSASSKLGGSFGTEITSINNLTINNPKGASLTGSNITLNGTFSLVSGKLTTGAYKVTIGNTGSVSRTDTSWVIGNLEKNIATGPVTATYEIGDSSNYTPVTVAFDNVTTGGRLMVATISGVHPNIASSTLSSTKRLNFYTKLTSTDLVYNNYSALVNFNNPANLVGSANPVAFISGVFNSGWTYPSMGLPASTSATASGMTNFGDLVFAEQGCTIAASAGSNTPVCAGSTIQLSSSTTGANGVVGYNWSGPAGFSASVQNPVITNASALNAGVYTLTTTDALGCISSTTTTVAVNAVPVAGITNNTGVTELTCTTPAINVTATGGNSYSWNNGLGNNASAIITAPGTYTVTATSNGCSSTESITITEDKTAPVAGINNITGSTELDCNTLSISVSATGGVAYSWSNSLGNNANATITAAGTYFVTVYGANGCSSTASIAITSNTTAPTAGIINNTGSTVLTCSLSSISVTATGGASYSWSHGLGNNASAAITAAGTYTVTVYGANGCSSTASITITSNTTAQTAGIINNTGETELNCNRSSISVTATGGGTYSWNNGLGSNANQTITAPGVYVVTVTGTNGCSSSASISITSNTTVPDAAIINNTAATVIDCNTTSISLTATGDGTYSWNNGLGANANQIITAAGTYTVTVTGANGCTATASTTITSNTTPPAASIINNTGATQLNCTSSSINVTATGGDSYLWSSGLGNDANQTLTSAGTYTVTVTGVNGCTSTASITITSNTTPPTVSIINNTGVTELTCNVLSISVTATGGGTYSWNNGLGNNANASITAPGTYAVLVTGANGCTADETITITADKFAPIAGITNNTESNVITCATPSISVTATGGVSYSWSNGLGNNANATITSAGTYTVTVTGDNGCTSTASITVTANTAAPIAGITNNTGSTTITCAVPSISVTATGGVSYSWNNGLGNTDNATITSAGTYTVTVTGANGCTSTSSINVAANTAAPVAGITNNSGTSVLTCSTTSINVTATGGGSYSWSNGLGETAAATITSAGTYTVTVTGSNGCTSAASITVTSNTTAPTALIVNNSGSVQITCATPSISVTATGGASYSWNNGLGNSANATITSAGTYTVTVTGSNGCTATDDITVTANTTAPNTGIVNNSGTNVITCNTPEINLTATGNGTYSWNNGLGDNANVGVTAPGTYTVTVTGSNGCTSTSSITITSNTTAPSAGIINNTGTTLINCLTSSISVTATGGISYEWSNGLGNEANATITDAGSYIVTVTGSNGCSSTASITVTSNTTVPTAGITNNTGSTVLTCATTSISLTATGGGTYSWNNGLGTNPTVTVTTPGTYTVTVTGASGCTSTASVVITVGPGVPTVGYTASATTVCAGTAVTLSGTGADSYSWTGGITNGVPFVPTATTTYTVTGTENIGGCSNTASVTITVNPIPTATISGSTSICTGGTATLSIAATGNGPWVGTLSDGTSFSGNTSPISVTVTPASSTTYTIASLTGASCPANSLNGSAVVSVNSFTVDTIVGPKNACIYSGTTSTLNATYSVAAVNASSFAWTVPTGATVISGAGTNSIVVHYASTFTTGTISVAVSSSCGAPITRTLAITKSLSAAPASITGPTSVCSYIGTSTQATYTAATVTGAIKYSWTLPSTVTIVSAAADSSSINVTFGAAYATSTFSVKAVVGCGTTTAKTLSVAGTAAAPVAGTPVTRCGAGLVTFSATPATGETIDWYSASTAGTLLRSGSLTFDSTYVSTGIKTVYATARNITNGCISATRTAVTATLNSLPTAVTVSTGASSCGAAALTLTATAPTGTTLEWYADSSTTGTLLATGTSFTTPVLSATTKYFVVSKSATNGCYSTSLKATTATINAVPASPTVNTIQSRCGAGSIVLTATAPTGSAVWFRNDVGGTALTTATTATVTYTTPASSVSDSTYYVATKSTNGCFSSRTAVLAKILTLPASPVTTGSSRCGAGTVTVSATPGAGETINWYSALTGGTLLATASNTYSPASISATTTYYAEASNGTCSSLRAAAVATVNALPAVSTGVPTSRCGAGTVTVAANPISGMTIDWYSASAAGTLLLSGSSSYTTTITATTTFYAATRNLTTGCLSSTRTAVAATLNALPATVASVTGASRCGTDTATLKATAVSGTTIDWFADTLRTTLIQSGTVTGVNTYLTPVISSTTSYWVIGRNLTTGCVSAASKAVTLTINAVPVSPTVNTTQSRCGTGSITLTATAPTGAYPVWYRNLSSTTALTSATTQTVTYATPSTSASDSTYYVASKTTAGCVSGRTAVLAKINAVPAAPTTTGTSICGAGRATVSASPNVADGTIDWYSAATSGTLLRSNSLTFDSLITATKTFYALTRVTTTGCVSATRAGATATVNALLAAPTSLTGTTSICPIVGTATGVTYTATAVTGAISYSWTIPAGAVIDSGSNGLKIKVRFITAGPNDSIYVQAVATTGCAGTKKVLKLVTTGCSTPIAKHATISATPTMNVSVYPNPTTSNFNVKVISADKEAITARIFDMQGRLLKSVKINPYETISVGAELKSGTYTIEIRQGKNVQSTRMLKF